MAKHPSSQAPEQPRPPNTSPTKHATSQKLLGEAPCTPSAPLTASRPRKGPEQALAVGLGGLPARPQHETSLPGDPSPPSQALLSAVCFRGYSPKPSPPAADEKNETPHFFKAHLLPRQCPFKSHPRATACVKRRAAEDRFNPPLATLRAGKPRHHRPQRPHARQAAPVEATGNITAGHSGYEADGSTQVTSRLL